MNKLDAYKMQSPDLNAERLNKLKELFPDIFTVEGKLNPEELKKIAAPGSVRETERFEFKWFGKAQAKRNAFTPSKGAFVYDEKRSVNPGKADGNLIIDGENLEVLKLLLCSYREEIKCIYIDPPYNTGKDFVYSDNYTEDRKAYWEQNGTTENGVKIDTNTETDGRFHSNWLDMMYSRLLIARQLLREDGVIFVSIDDNEVHHLRMLMNEVFGEENFISQIVVKSNPRGSQSSHLIGVLHEYIIVFAKEKAAVDIIGHELTDEMLDEYKHTDENGKKYRLLGLRQRGGFWKRSDRPLLFYPIFVNPNNEHISLEKNKDFCIEVYPIQPSTGEEGSWRWSKQKLEKDKDLIIAKFVKRNGVEKKEWDIFQLDYLDSNDGKIKRTKAKTIWDEKEINYQNGTNEIKTLFESIQIFDFPKPLQLIKNVISMIECERQEYILDFFAGSGATAQAVMELNREDGGNRKFILVQLPELTDEKSEAYKAGYKKIPDITIERTKRTIEKLINEQEENPSLFPEIRKEFGFNVFHLAKSAFPRVEFAPDPEKSEEENIDLFKQYIKEKEASLYTLFNDREIIAEVLLKNGFMLDYSIEPSDIFKGNKVYLVKDNYKEAFICLDTNLKHETVEYFKIEKDRVFICLERALDTTKKWNLKHYLGDNFMAF